MAFGIDHDILESLARVFAWHPIIQEARIYGSRARGDHRNGSDIDIALFAPGLSYNEFLRVGSELDDLPWLYKFDTTHFDTLESEALKESILRESLSLYRRDRSGEYAVPAAEPLFVREDFPEYGVKDK